MDKQKWYPCQCGGEVLSVYWGDREDVVEFAICQKHPSTLRLWERIQECIKILDGQSDLHSEIILRGEQAEELAMDLLGGVKSRRAARIRDKKP